MRKTTVTSIGTPRIVGSKTTIGIASRLHKPTQTPEMAINKLSQGWQDVNNSKQLNTKPTSDYICWTHLAKKVEDINEISIGIPIINQRKQYNCTHKKVVYIHHHWSHLYANVFSQGQSITIMTANNVMITVGWGITANKVGDRPIVRRLLVRKV